MALDVDAYADEVKSFAVVRYTVFVRAGDFDGNVVVLGCWVGGFELGSELA